MANPIKPTGPRGMPSPSSDPSGGGPDVSAPRTERAGRGDFRRELEGAGAARDTPAAQGATQATSSASTSGAQAARGTASVLEDLRAGNIDRTQAIDRLVAHQIERVAPAGLSPVARGELESLLRSSLENDPNLARWMEDATGEG